MGNKKRLAVVIGRFNPCHIFHVQTLLARAMEYDHVLVLLGSSRKARTWKDPLHWEERKRLIELTAAELGFDNVLSKVDFAPIKDYPYTDNRWLFQVQEAVELACQDLEGQSFVDDHPGSELMEDWEPILVGVDKDMSTFYLKMFPQWEQDVFEPEGNTTQYSATQVREALFEGRLPDVAHMLTRSTIARLATWRETDVGQQLQAEYLKAKGSKTVLAYQNTGNLPVDPEERGDYIREVIAKLAQQADSGCSDDLDAEAEAIRQELIASLTDTEIRVAPYDPIYHTVDSVVTWRGHILFIRRRAHPGKGLWALPGGFLEPHEWPRDGAVRERTEESKLKFFHKGSKRRLHLHRDWCKSSHEFAHPGRSLRGRTITNAYHWVIPAEYEV